MKKYIIIGLIVIIGVVLLVVPLFNDEPIIVEDNTEPPAIFAFQENLATKGREKVQLEIQINDTVEKLELFYNDSLFGSWKNPKSSFNLELDAGIFGVGARTLLLVSTLKDGSSIADDRLVRVLSDIIPKKLIIQVLNEYPHNTMSFTQGLEFYNGALYEGTGDPGNMGKSIIAEVDLLTGDLIKTMGLGAGFFGEGITIFNNTAYQLTWQNQKCYTYSLEKDLQLSGEFNYTGEGWGLCNDGQALIMSNGTERLVYRDPTSFGIIKTVNS